MKVYIPRPVTRAVPYSIYKSIIAQKVIECEIVEVIASSDGIESVNHRVRTKNLILELANKIDEPFFVMLDSDTELLIESNLFEMYDAMLKDSKLGAVSLANKKTNGHVDIACTMIRTEAVKDIQFKSEYGGCECNAFGFDLERKGYIHRYLDRTQRIKTVKEGRNV